MGYFTLNANYRNKYHLCPPNSVANSICVSSFSRYTPYIKRPIILFIVAVIIILIVVLIVIKIKQVDRLASYRSMA